MFNEYMNIMVHTFGKINFRKVLFCSLMVLLFAVINIPTYMLVSDKSNARGKCVYEWTEQHHSKSDGYYNVNMSVILNDNGLDSYIINTTCNEFNKTKHIPWEQTTNGFFLGMALAIGAADLSFLICLGLGLIVLIIFHIGDFYRWAFKS